MHVNTNPDVQWTENDADALQQAVLLLLRGFALAARSGSILNNELHFTDFYVIVS